MEICDEFINPLTIIFQSNWDPGISNEMTKSQFVYFNHTLCNIRNCDDNILSTWFSYFHLFYLYEYLLSSTSLILNTIVYTKYVINMLSINKVFSKYVIKDGHLAPVLSAGDGTKPFVVQNYQIYIYHDDVIKWEHFLRYWPLARGIHRWPVNSPHKGRWRGALMFSLIYAWIKGWVNNREAGDLRRHCAHYDVTVMTPFIPRSYLTA